MLNTTIDAGLFEGIGLPRPALILFESSMLADARLARLCTLIRERYTDAGFTLTEASEKVAASPDHLNRLLRKACGVTFKQLVIQFRVAEAVEVFIKEPTAIVEEVAQRVGFNDISNFGKQFKQRLGCTPKFLKRIISLATPRKSIFAQPLSRLRARLAGCCTEKKPAGFFSWFKRPGSGGSQDPGPIERPGLAEAERLTGGELAVSSGP